MRALPVLACLFLLYCEACSRSPLPVVLDSSYTPSAENKPIHALAPASDSSPTVASTTPAPPLSLAAKVAELIVPRSFDRRLAPMLLVDKKRRYTLCRIQVQEEGGLALQVMVIAPDGQSHQNVEVCDPNECKGPRVASVNRLETSLAQIGISDVEPVEVSPWPSKQSDVDVASLGAKLSVKGGKVTLTRKAQRPTVLGNIETSKSNKTRLTAFAYSLSTKMLVLWTAQDPDTAYDDGSGLPDEVYAWSVPQ